MTVTILHMRLACDELNIKILSSMFAEYAGLNVKIVLVARPNDCLGVIRVCLTTCKGTIIVYHLHEDKETRISLLYRAVVDLAAQVSSTALAKVLIYLSQNCRASVQNN